MANDVPETARGPGRPTFIYTGKPGKPRKKYNVRKSKASINQNVGIDVYPNHSEEGKAKKSIYGLAQSGRVLNNKKSDRQKKKSLEPLKADPNFYFQETDQTITWRKGLESTLREEGTRDRPSLPGD